MNFSFSFGQTQCNSRLCSPRQTSLTTASDVSLICLETSHSSSRSSGSIQQYDSIPFKMVDGHQLLCSGHVHSSSGSQYIIVYGCQPLWIGSSSRADKTILSWSLVWRPIPAPYRYVRNNGHSFSTEESHKIHTPLLWYDLYRQYNSGLLYQKTRRNTFSQPMCRGMGEPPLVLGTWYCAQSLSYTRQIQYIDSPSLEIRQTSQNRMGFGSINSEFHFPNAQLSQCGFVCDTIQSQTSIVCISSSRQSCLSDRCIVNELELSSCICSSTNNSDTLCTSQDTSISVQNSSYFSSLAPKSVVLRGDTTISISSNSSSTLSKTTDIIKRKVSTFKSIITRSSRLGVIKQSIRDKKFSQNIADFVSKSRRTSTQKVYDSKWVIYSNWCRRKKVNLVSAPLTVIADFLIYLFSEKKYQISTIKGYRSMISNTPKFKTGNRIGSNPVL